MPNHASTIKLLLCAALIGGALTSNCAAAGQRPAAERVRAPFPALDLGSKQVGGQMALDRLGADIGTVASWYGKSAQQFKNELLNDRRMRLDKAGRLLAVEDMNAPLGADPISTAAAVQEGSLVSLDQTFTLHSRPGANRTIYLDFNGATITNTAWNSNGNTINALPYDIDGNTAAFSTTELQRIQYIWQRVAEDYAAFDVDITTEQPAADALTRSGTSDQVFGTTVVITKSTGVYSCSCGGIAYVGVFNDAGGSRSPDYYKPALVFYDMLGGGAEKPVAEAISHEAGHNVGLHHDGSATDSYYAGQGTDAVTAWAPIMGVGYYKPLVQFSKGEYAGASNTEDDFAVAQSFGLPLRGDDAGNSPASALPLQASVASGTASARIDGVIETAGDRDVFAIAAGAGVITATASPASRSANADLVLSLMDQAGNILVSANPANALAASLSFTVPAQGTYYLMVTGTGQGDPSTTGYSAYGSVGNYRISTSFPAASGNAPSAVISANVTSGDGPLAVSFDGAQSTDDGHIAFWYWDFGDGTTDQSGALSAITHVYAAPGTYLARLTVVDDTGLVSSATQTIAVASAAARPGVQIADLRLVSNRRGIAAVARVVVTGQNGQLIAGAKVQASWSGAVAKSALRKSSRSGSASIASPASKAGGCFTITITGVSAPGFSPVSAALPTAQICS